jgi:hypothetical protein
MLELTRPLLKADRIAGKIGLILIEWWIDCILGLVDGELVVPVSSACLSSTCACLRREHPVCGRF